LQAAGVWTSAVHQRFFLAGARGSQQTGRRVRTNRSLPPAVSLDTWRELAEAARVFQQLAPWERMSSREMLGLGDPRSGRFAVAVVIGGQGAQRALALYRGDQGLRSLAYAVTGQVHPGEQPGAIFNLDMLQLVFVPKNALAKEELRLLERLRFHPPGDKGSLWPRFRSFRPGYLPWHSTQDEAEGFCGGLRKVIEYTKLFAEAAGVFAGREPLEVPFYPADPGFAGPLRTEDLQWHKLTAPPPAPAPAFNLSEADSAQAQALPKREDWTWELDSFFVARAVDEGDRPYFLKVAVVLDARSGIALRQRTAGPQLTLERLAGRALADAIQEVKTRPATVHVGRQSLVDALAELAGQCGLAVKLAGQMPAVAALRQSLQESLRGR
jgi:hypothetical protein